MKKLLFLLALLVFFPYNSYADELEFLCCSYHFERNGQNEFNPGLIYSHNLTDEHLLTGGVFKNSFSNVAVIAGYTYKYHWNDNWFGSITAGVRTGYPEESNWPRWLAVIPTVGYKHIRIHAAPTFVGAGFAINF